MFALRGVEHNNLLSVRPHIRCMSCMHDEWRDHITFSKDRLLVTYLVGLSEHHHAAYSLTVLLKTPSFLDLC